MPATAMHEFEEVKQHIDEIVRRELDSTRIVRIHIHEGLTSFDEAPAYHIGIIFDGDLPGGKKTSSLNSALQKHLWEIKDDHFPIPTYIRVENEAKHYATS